MKSLTKHTDLSAVFSFLRETISWRIQHPETRFQDNAPGFTPESFGSSLLARFISDQALSHEETIVLLLAITPHLSPDFLVNTVSDEFPGGTDLPIFGGVKGKNHRGIIPTGETIQFLLGGTDVQSRIDCLHLFSEDSKLIQQNIVYLDSVGAGEPLMSGRLLMVPDALHLLTTGVVPPPKLSTEFPAQRLKTQLTWEDLVLNEKTMEHIRELEIWLQYHHTLMEDWGMKNRIKDGYRVLFYGPSGTGKTLTATLLGKYTDKPVYRVDLSTVVSKYIGETEKHLASLFDRAAHKDWILFFDEADAIFGKRTNVRDAHDKYANQEVSYLLQRIEGHPGLVILASNYKDNIDDAFTRRFQSIFAFELPGARERLLLWEKNLPAQLSLAPEVDLEAIAKKYDLTGSNIINIIQYCSLKVLSQQSNVLTTEILIEGIKREYLKENRLF